MLSRDARGRRLALAAGLPASVLAVVLLLAPAIASPVTPLGFTRIAPFTGITETLVTNVSASNDTKILTPDGFNLTTGLGAVAVRASFVNSPTTPVTSYVFTSVRLSMHLLDHRTGTHNVTVVWHFSYDASLFASRNHCAGTCFQGTADAFGWVFADLQTLAGSSVATGGTQNGTFVNQIINATHNASAVWLGDADKSALVLKFSVAVTGGTTYVLSTGYYVSVSATYGAATVNMGGVGDDHARLVSINFA